MPAAKASPRLARLAGRVAPEASSGGRDPWEIHVDATTRLAAGDDVIMLSIGQEVEERTPEPVLRAARDALDAGRHHYDDIRGTQALRQAIARHHHEQVGQAADAAQIVVSSGAQNALFSLGLVLLEPGDEVVMPDPYYTTYPATFTASGATAVPVPLDDSLRLDPDALRAAVTPRTRVLVLNAPNNPVGGGYDQAVWETAVSLCITHGSWLVVDLVYLDVVDPGTIVLPHALPGAADVVISVGSLSKSHRMTGWRVGWTVSPPPVATALADLSLCMHYGLPPFVMDAALAALEQAADTPATVAAALAERRAVVLDALPDPSPLIWHDSGQGMFMLLDTRATGVDAYSFAKALLAREAVALLPCDGFGARGLHLVRLGLCTGPARLREACRRIRRFTDSLAAD